MVIRRVMNDKGQYDHIEVDIISLPLRDILSEVGDKIYGFEMSGDGKVAILHALLKAQVLKMYRLLRLAIFSTAVTNCRKGWHRKKKNPLVMKTSSQIFPLSFNPSTSDIKKKI